jgi:hypothetical protein
MSGQRLLFSPIADPKLAPVSHDSDDDFDEADNELAMVASVNRPPASIAVPVIDSLNFDQVRISHFILLSNPRVFSVFCSFNRLNFLLVFRKFPTKQSELAKVY